MNFKETLQKLREKGSKYTVLYVEDESEIRETTGVLLKLIFGHVDAAADGADGLKQYQSRAYDLVVSDLLMPVMSGYEMIRHILEENPSQCIVVTTACEEELYSSELAAMGVTHLLSKPMSAEQIVETLYRVLDSKTC